MGCNVTQQPQRALQLQDARGGAVQGTNLSLAPCTPRPWISTDAKPVALLGDDADECVQVTIAPPLKPATAYQLVLPAGSSINRLSGPLSAPLAVHVTGLQPFRFDFVRGRDAYAVAYRRVALQLRLGLLNSTSIDALGRAIRVQHVATLDAPLQDADTPTTPTVVQPIAPDIVPVTMGNASLALPRPTTASCAAGAACLDASGRRLLGAPIPKQPSVSGADALAPYFGASGTPLQFNITRPSPGVVQLTIPLQPLWVVSVSVDATSSVRDAFDQPLQASSGVFATAALDGFMVQPDTQPKTSRYGDAGMMNGPRGLVLVDGSDAWDGAWPVLTRRWQRVPKSWDQGGSIRDVSAWSIAVGSPSQRRALLGQLQSGVAVSYGKVRDDVGSCTMALLVSLRVR